MKRPRLRSHLQRLQKTKIPARGLKRVVGVQRREGTTRIPSKNQNPREGIETQDDRPIFPSNLYNFLQKTKIPARGLKPYISKEREQHRFPASKNQNPREGIETHREDGTAAVKDLWVFKKPKSPRGD